MENYGFLAVLPPIISIALAVFTKNVIVSLFVGCFVGAIFIAGWNPLIALHTMIIEYFFPQMADSYNAQAYFMMALVGAFATLLTASGGGLAFMKSKKLGSLAKNRKMAEVATWIGGLFIWFSDTSNSLIVGPTFENINNAAKVSKEKFSYILDCTTSPICALVPIMGWGVYIMSLVDKEIAENVSINMTSWDMFISSIPYNLYAILTLAMCGFLAWTQWDFGPMLRAQLRAETTGKCNADDAIPMRRTKEISLPEGVEPRLITILLPLAIVLICIFTILPLHGFPYKPVPGPKIRAAIAYGFICGTITLCIMLPRLKIMSFQKCIDTFMDGMAGMMYICAVLLLAWSLSSMCKTLGTAPYLVEMTKRFLHPLALPSLLFVSCAVISFATGTSWGTYALVMPLAMAFATELDVSLPIVLGAVVSGGLFGDHSSPISDTTILAAMGAGGDLVDHFRTQMPYALLIGIICTVLYFFGAVLSPILLIVFGLFIATGATFVLHKQSIRRYALEFKRNVNN